MKRIILTSLVATNLLFAADAGLSKQEQETLHKIKQIGIFKTPNITLDKIVEHKDIYHVGGTNKVVIPEQNIDQIVNIDAFVTKDLSTVILGKAYNSANGEALHIPMDMSSFKDLSVVTVGSGKKEYHLFTDPECPFCQDLELEISKLSKEKLQEIKIYVYFYPLERIHPNARMMSYYIMSQKDNGAKYKAMNQVMIEKSTSYKNAKFSVAELEKYKDLIDKQIDVATKKLNVNGTPTMFDATGKQINPSILFK